MNSDEVDPPGGVEVDPPPQVLSLSWPDFPQSVVSVLKSLKEEDDFIDVTLACHSRQFSAHKVVLSACSPYFRRLLKVSKHGGEEEDGDEEEETVPINIWLGVEC